MGNGSNLSGRLYLALCFTLKQMLVILYLSSLMEFGYVPFLFQSSFFVDVHSNLALLACFLNPAVCSFSIFYVATIQWLTKLSCHSPGEPVLPRMLANVEKASTTAQVNTSWKLLKDTSRDFCSKSGPNKNKVLLKLDTRDSRLDMANNVRVLNNYSKHFANTRIAHIWTLLMLWHQHEFQLVHVFFYHKTISCILPFLRNNVSNSCAFSVHQIQKQCHVCAKITSGYYPSRWELCCINSLMWTK